MEKGKQELQRATKSTLLSRAPSRSLTRQGRRTSPTDSSISCIPAGTSFRMLGASKTCARATSSGRDRPRYMDPCASSSSQRTPPPFPSPSVSDLKCGPPPREARRWGPPARLSWARSSFGSNGRSVAHQSGQASSSMGLDRREICRGMCLDPNWVVRPFDLEMDSRALPAPCLL